MKNSKLKTKNKPISILQVMYKWLQLSLDQALTILIWILTWSVLEPYVKDINTTTRCLIILLLIIILQRDVVKTIRQKKTK